MRWGMVIALAGAMLARARDHVQREHDARVQPAP